MHCLTTRSPTTITSSPLFLPSYHPVSPYPHPHQYFTCSGRCSRVQQLFQHHTPSTTILQQMNSAPLSQSLPCDNDKGWSYEVPPCESQQCPFLLSVSVILGETICSVWGKEYLPFRAVVWFINTYSKDIIQIIMIPSFLYHSSFSASLLPLLASFLQTASWSFLYTFCRVWTPQQMTARLILL